MNLIAICENRMEGVTKNMRQQSVFFEVAGPVLIEVNRNPSELNIARGLVAVTEEFKRGCSQDGDHGVPWGCQPCTEAYLSAVRKLILDPPELMVQGAKATSILDHSSGSLIKENQL